MNPKFVKFFTFTASLFGVLISIVAGVISIGLSIVSFDRGHYFTGAWLLPLGILLISIGFGIISVSFGD